MATSHQGECVLRREGDDLLVDKADPMVRITAEFIRGVERAVPCSPIRLVWPEGLGPDPVFGTCVGAVLRIEAVNRTVIYRLVEYEFQPDWYLAEWPD